MAIRTFPVLAALVLAASSQAATFELASDFSNVDNPNGAWSFTQGAALLPHQTSCSPENPFTQSLADGFWGAGCNLNSQTPEVARVTADGTASGQTTGDWLAGDVVLHSTNPGSGPALFIRWTAPADGSIDYTISAWYAHSAVVRSNDVFVTLNDAPLHAGTVLPGLDRDSPLIFGDTALAVTAGDVFAVSFVPSAGQTFGSLAGLSETVEFTAAVPEPGSAALMLAGVALLGSRLRRRAG